MQDGPHVVLITEYLVLMTWIMLRRQVMREEIEFWHHLVCNMGQAQTRDFTPILAILEPLEYYVIVSPITHQIQEIINMVSEYRGIDSELLFNFYSLPHGFKEATRHYLHITEDGIEIVENARRADDECVLYIGVLAREPVDESATSKCGDFLERIAEHYDIPVQTLWIAEDYNCASVMPRGDPSPLAPDERLSVYGGNIVIYGHNLTLGE